MVRRLASKYVIALLCLCCIFIIGLVYSLYNCTELFMVSSQFKDVLGLLLKEENSYTTRREFFLGLSLVAL